MTRMTMSTRPEGEPDTTGAALGGRLDERTRRSFEVARVPEEEAQRLAALAGYAVLDTPPERDLDVLLAGLAEVCEAPITLLSLVDGDRQWFKARVGIELRETPRGLAFAAHTILGDGLFEVPDATADPRFAGNPLVTGEPGICFYAGVPLRTPAGHNIGSVCVIDRVPRRLSGVKREALQHVAGEVMAQLECRRRLGASPGARNSAIGGRDPPPTQDTSLVGTRFGRYTILRELGRGATATVYTAYDDQLERKVAIKLIRDRQTGAAREAQAFARISHPNVVQIYEVGRFADHEFIAMELVDGVTLTTWQGIGSRSAYEVIAKYAQAGRGLVAAHQAGLVHRDFKPDNVLIDSQGRPRVGDFGLAMLQVPAATRDREATLRSSRCATTRDDFIAGTPAYMAPEQLLNFEVDERADQFSLCAALQEAVYGVRPFAGASVDEVRANALAGVMQEPLAGVRAPPRLRGLLRRGLAIDPAERWPTLAELLDQLDRLDARRDPGAGGRQRGRLVASLAAVSAMAIGAQLVMGADDTRNHLYMIVTSSALLTVMGVGVYLTRTTLLRNDFHRRMIVVALATIIGATVTRLIVTGAGFLVAERLVIEMLLVGQVFLVAGVFISRLLLLNCLIFWAGAAAVAFAVPGLHNPAPYSLIGLGAFAFVWSYGPRIATHTSSSSSR